MTVIDIIGFLGVSLLLIAYFLNLNDKLDKNSLTYLIINCFGDLLACLASILMKYLPFIILEGCWNIVTAIGLFKYLKNKNH